MSKRESEARFKRGTEWVVLEGPALEARDKVRAELDGLLLIVNADLNKRPEDDRTRQGVAMDRALIHATTAMDYLRHGAPLAALPSAIMAAAFMALGCMKDDAYALAAERALAGDGEAPLVTAVREASAAWRGLHPFLTTIRMDRWGHPVRVGKEQRAIPSNVPACFHAGAVGPMGGLVSHLASRAGARPAKPGRNSAR